MATKKKPAPVFIDKVARKLPSRHTSVGPASAPHRSYYYAMRQPFVRVVTTWNEATLRNLIIAITLVGLLTSAPFGTSAQSEFRPMKAADIEKAVIANTITGLGRRGDCTFYDHFANDGSATAKCGSYMDSGRWRLAEDKLCVKWSKRPTETCLSLQTDGTKFLIVNPDRGLEPFPFSILAGKQER